MKTLEKWINNKLRAHRVAQARSRENYSSEDADLTKDQVYREEIFEDTLEHLQDFSLDEVSEMLLEERIAKRFLGIIGQGKEANVYWIRDFSNKPQAVKMFRIHTTSHNFHQYHARSKMSDTAKLTIATQLAVTEFKYLQILYTSGIRVPKPLYQKEFLFGMEFLGSKRGASPLLRNVNFSDYGLDAVDVLDELLDQVDLMFNRAMIVHGDFSEHNIIIHDNRPYIIDFLQSKQYHPEYSTAEKIRKREALVILRKDIESLMTYFKRNHRVYYDTNIVYTEIAGNVNDWSPDDLMPEYFDPEAFEQLEKQKRYRV